MNPTRYTHTAIALHWLVALCIFVPFPLGVYMHELPLSPTKLQLYSYHKWLGIGVLLLAAARVLWRVGHRPPPLPAAMPPWQQGATHAVHHALYLLMLAVPLSGWLMSSALGFSVVWFGMLPLPDLVRQGQGARRTAQARAQGPQRHAAAFGRHPHCRHAEAPILGSRQRARPHAAVPPGEIMNPVPILPGLASAALLAGAAQAAEFNTVQLDKSQITFVSRQMGVPVALFCEIGDKIEIDTRTSEFRRRVAA